MDIESLKQNIAVILNAETERQTIEWITEREGGPLPFFDADPDESMENILTGRHNLQSENYTMLRALFGRLTADEEKNVFLNEIERACRSQVAAALAFLFLIKQRGIAPALQLLYVESLVSITPLGHNPRMSCLELLDKYVRYEHNSLSKEDLDDIERKIHHIIMYPEYDIVRHRGQQISNLKKNASEIAMAKGFAQDINQNINKIRYVRLSKDLLEGINLEINQDRDTVDHYLKQFGFSSELIESIHYVESAYQSAESGFDYKTCADQLRSFVSGFTKEVADTVAQHDGDTRNKEPAKYLRDKGFFNSKQESDLFQAFMDYLSSDSVHQLNSDREVARIGKNVAIEFTLLLSERLEKYLELGVTS